MQMNQIPARFLFSPIRAHPSNPRNPCSKDGERLHLLFCA